MDRPGNWEETTRDTIAKETEYRLSTLDGHRQIGVLMQGAHQFADQNISGITEGLAQQSRFNLTVRNVACKPGCAFCCMFRISVLPLEALRIAQHVESEFDAEQRAKLTARIDAYAENLDQLHGQERVDTPLECPFLQEGGECGIYAVRPLACRMHHSLSREACEAALTDPKTVVPIVPDYIKATMPIARGLHRGSKGAGKYSNDLEFIPAMKIALEEPDAEVRWLAGESVFEAAVDEELQELQAKAQRNRPTS